MRAFDYDSALDQFNLGPKKMTAWPDYERRIAAQEAAMDKIRSQFAEVRDTLDETRVLLKWLYFCVGGFLIILGFFGMISLIIRWMF